MSRIGRKEIILPAGVELSLAPDNTVTVKGPKGTLTQQQKEWLDNGHWKDNR